MGSNDDAIEPGEGRFHVRLPEDYRHFLVTEGSMARFVPPADDFLMIHAAEELIEINAAGGFQDRFPGSVVIGGDGGREMLANDFRQEPPSLVLLDVSAEDWSMKANISWFGPSDSCSIRSGVSVAARDPGSRDA
ncbi:hypothetical protein [Streptomyces fagopyri]|uniref:hypothetical protein n=1 Tax=Streptomyces fagopyri TaxID=2662397 RepID=UPI0037170D6C